MGIYQTIKTGNTNLDNGIEITSKNRLICIGIDKLQDVYTLLGEMPKFNKDLKVLATSKALYEKYDNGENDLFCNNSNFTVAEESTLFSNLHSLERYLMPFKKAGGNVFIWECLRKYENDITEIVTMLHKIAVEYEITIILLCSKSFRHHDIVPCIRAYQVSDIIAALDSETNTVFVRKNINSSDCLQKIQL